MAFPQIIEITESGEVVPVRKPLEVTFDPDEATLDEICLFEDGGFTAQGFRQFLIDHTNWDKKEIGKLTINELKEVMAQLGAKLQAQSVPLES